MGCKGFPLICFDNTMDGASALNQLVPLRATLLLVFSGRIGSARLGREFRIDALF